MTTVASFEPDVLLVYKGNGVTVGMVRRAKRSGVFTANVFPDCSPHAQGTCVRQAIGEYDLVASTKPFHPEAWTTTYGYANRCRFVPQGYDPRLHLVSEPPMEFRHDVVLAATFRPDYGSMMIELGRLMPDTDFRVAIAGFGWDSIRGRLPRHWELRGPLIGHSYVLFLRTGRICIAPLTGDVVVGGRTQSGDVDTTRTYELAAANCFFLHRRTDYARTLYDESEVAMFDDPPELVALVRYFLKHDSERKRMAAKAHRRAVPLYSLDRRAEAIVKLLREELDML